MKPFASLSILAALTIFLAGCGHQDSSIGLVPTVYAETENFTFQDYDKKKVERLMAEDPSQVVLFFASRGCGSCAGKHKEMSNYPEKFEGTVFRVEFEDSSEEVQRLKKKYGITKWDAFVRFDANGNHTTHKAMDIKELQK